MGQNIDVNRGGFIKKLISVLITLLLMLFLVLPIDKSNSTPRVDASEIKVEYELKPPKIISYDMLATAYTAAEDECGRPSWHPDYGRTASGEFVREGIIAADTSVLPMHSRVYIIAGEYSGYYEVKDTGGAIVGNRIDIYFPTKAQAYKFGRRNVTVQLIKE